jgi:hypothetical protein
MGTWNYSDMLLNLEANKQMGKRLVTPAIGVQ